MQYKSAAIIVAGLAAQQVAAFGWSDASAFSCPGNTNNHCSGSQAGGYDWSGLQPGSFDSYGSNKFSGFTCSSSFGKRDLLSKRGFQPKCITGSLDSNPSISGDNQFSIDQMQISSSQDTDIDCEYSMPDGSTCHETHSCSQGGSIFQNSQCGGAKSVTFKPGRNAPSGCTIGVHSVGFHCGPASSTVPASVPPSTPPASSPPKSTAPPYTCQGPQCSSATVPTTSASSPPESSSSPICSGPGCSSAPAPPPSTVACYGNSCSSSVPSVPSVSSVPTASSAPPVSTVPTYGCVGTTCSVTSPVSSVPTSGCVGPACSGSVTVPVSSAPSVPSMPSGSSVPSYPGCTGSDCSSSAPVSVPSGSAPVPSGSAPVPSGSAPVPSGSAPVPSGSAPVPSGSAPVPSGSVPAPGCYGNSCGSSSVAVPSSPVSVPSSSSVQPVSSTQGVPGYGSSSSPVAPVSSSTAPTSYPTPNCPGLLPRCLNTWMYMSGCKDNAQSDCFCGNEMFIKNVMGCISAWGSDAETQAAASYLMGLCANHVSTNPAIITACPSTVTPGPSPAGFTPSSAGPITSAPPANSAPCTTITYSSSVVIPATFTTGVSSGLTCPGSSITTSLITTVTVPQVQITTSTVTTAGTTTQSVGLGAGSPSPVPAYTTSAGAIPTSAPPPYGTTFGTSFAATASVSGPPIVPATGAGAKTVFSLSSVLLGAIAALAAL